MPHANYICQSLKLEHKCNSKNLLKKRGQIASF
jgi:hypothetical protein